MKWNKYSVPHLFWTCVHWTFVNVEFEGRLKQMHLLPKSILHGMSMMHVFGSWTMWVDILWILLSLLKMNASHILHFHDFTIWIQIDLNWFSNKSYSLCKCFQWQFDTSVYYSCWPPLDTSLISAIYDSNLILLGAHWLGLA